MRAHEHPVRIPSAPVEQAIPTLPFEPVVTPQPSVNVTGVSARRHADDSLLSSRRTGSEPSAPVDPQLMGAEGATSRWVSPTRDNAPPPVTVRPPPRSTSATQCPTGLHCAPQPYPPRARPPRILTLRARIPREKSCCFGNPPSFFRNGQRRRLSSTTFRIVAQSNV